MRVLTSMIPINKLLRLPWILKSRAASSTGGSSTKMPVPKETTEVYDEKSDMIQILDMEDLPRAQQRYAKQFEKVNDERIKEIFAKNYKVGFPLLIYL